MRRIRLVLAVVAVMVAMLTAVSGPAMADDFDGFDDGFGFCGNGFFDGFGGCGNFFFAPSGVTQVLSNEGESGDVTLGFSVS